MGNAFNWAYDILRPAMEAERESESLSWWGKLLTKLKQ